MKGTLFVVDIEVLMMRSWEDPVPARLVYSEHVCILSLISGDLNIQTTRFGNLGPNKAFSGSTRGLSNVEIPHSTENTLIDRLFTLVGS